MVETENTFSYLEATREYIEMHRHGAPLWHGGAAGAAEKAA
jgi:hypothetical protein